MLGKELGVFQLQDLSQTRLLRKDVDYFRVSEVSPHLLQVVPIRQRYNNRSLPERSIKFFFLKAEAHYDEKNL